MCLTFSPETLAMLRDVPTGHQVENLVRIDRRDVNQWMPDKRILYLKGEKTRYLTTGEPLPDRGKFFIVW